MNFTIIKSYTFLLQIKEENLLIWQHALFCPFAFHKLNFRFLVARQISYFDNKLFCNRISLYEEKLPKINKIAEGGKRGKKVLYKISSGVLNFEILIRDIGVLSWTRQWETGFCVSTAKKRAKSQSWGTQSQLSLFLEPKIDQCWSPKLEFNNWKYSQTFIFTA